MLSLLRFLLIKSAASRPYGPARLYLSTTSTAMAATKRKTSEELEDASEGTAEPAAAPAAPAPSPADSESDMPAPPLTPPPVTSPPKKQRKTKTPPKPSSKKPNDTSEPSSAQLDIAMLFDEITAAVSGQVFSEIVARMNEKLGQKKLAQNVRRHWKSTARAAMLKGY
ncbi:hypothetical protein EDC01DRAFT_642850, partial [Geopyxis carbonaria]